MTMVPPEKRIPPEKRPTETYEAYHSRLNSESALTDESSSMNKRGIVREISVDVPPSAPPTEPSRKRLRRMEENRDEQLLDAVEQGRRIIQAARTDAEKLLHDAQAIAQTERTRAREQGFEEGKIKAAELILAAEAVYRTTVSRAHQGLLDLVFQVAEEVVGESLRVQPESVAARIARAVEQAIVSRRLVLVVHPTDSAYVRGSLDRLRAKVPGEIVFGVEEDENIPQGDARLATDFGTIEASVAAHLAALKNHLREVLTSGAEDA